MVANQLIGFLRQFLRGSANRDDSNGFAPELAEQIDYFARQTPSHLAGYLKPDCPDLGLGPGGHGEDIAIGFRLTCRCDEQSFKVTAHSWVNPDFGQEVMLSPITAVCSNCQNSIVVFDSRIHGYNPVACNYSATTVSGEEVEESTLTNLATLEAPETVDIIMYYPDDLFDAEFDNFEKADCFTWITIIVGANTSPEYPMLSYECA